MDEQAVNSGNTPYDWSSFRSIYDANGNVHDTDWIDSMFKDNARTQSYTLGITGGSQTSTYALSLGYMSQEGVVGGKDVSNYERYNFRINSEHKIFKDSDLLKVGEQVSFVYKEQAFQYPTNITILCAVHLPLRRLLQSIAITMLMILLITIHRTPIGITVTAILMVQ